MTILRVVAHPAEVQISKKEVVDNPGEMKESNALWELDHVGIISVKMRNKSKEVLRHYEDTVKYSSEENRCTVNLPCNDKKYLLPTNF